MEKTELKHWKNGWDIRGTAFHTFAIQVGKLGILLSIQIRGKKYFNLQLFQLI